MTIDKALNEFSLYASTKYTAKTYEVYLLALEKFFKWVNKKELKDVKIGDICKYSILMKQRGYADSYNGYTMLIIRQLYKYFFLQQKIKLDWRLIPIPKYTVNSFVAIEDKEYYAMLEQIKSSGFQELRDKLIINFLYSSGVRVGELCKINIENIHLIEQYASIFSEKNNKRRMILWDNPTQALLEKYLLERQRLAITNAVFINLKYYSRISTRSIERLVETLRKKAGILRPISPHSFRHGCGMRAVARSMNLRYLQVFLGHKNLESSKFYMDYKDDGLVREYQKIFCNNENKIENFVERETVEVNKQFNYLKNKIK
ncbi:tyrosine-type recombinase/integrase [Candidatus Dojkabacteria bacterium]|jgi:site-specific recombinase XerD|nr:tyrosine-type recombinase/integrase [Candidatus Dojkabacteria bacterium]